MGYLDSLFVIPADVGVNYLNELLNGCSMPVPRIEQLHFQSPEEALTGSIVGEHVRCNGSRTRAATGLQWSGARLGSIRGNSNALGDILAGYSVGVYKFVIFIAHVELPVLRRGLSNSL